MISLVDLGRYLSAHISHSVFNKLLGIGVSGTRSVADFVAETVLGWLGTFSGSFFVLLFFSAAGGFGFLLGVEKYFDCFDGRDCIRLRNSSSFSDLMLNCFI